MSVTHVGEESIQFGTRCSAAMASGILTDLHGPIVREGA
jgi:hypothetical protein